MCLRITSEKPSSSNDASHCPHYSHAKNQDDHKCCFEEKTKCLKKTRNLIPYSKASGFFQRSHLTQTMHPIFLFSHAKIGKSLVFWGKWPNALKNGNFIPYNKGLRFFRISYIYFRRCTILSSTIIQNLGRSMEQFQRTGKKVKNTVFWTLNPQ